MRDILLVGFGGDFFDRISRLIIREEGVLNRSKSHGLDGASSSVRRSDPSALYATLYPTKDTVLKPGASSRSNPQRHSARRIWPGIFPPQLNGHWLGPHIAFVVAPPPILAPRFAVECASCLPKCVLEHPTRTLRWWLFPVASSTIGKLTKRVEHPSVLYAMAA